MKLTLTKRAQKELDRIPDPIARNITRHISVLPQEPHPRNSKKMQGQENYRLRIGSFRVLYSIDKKTREIVILRIADRKTIYR